MKERHKKSLKLLKIESNRNQEELSLVIFE